MSLTSNYTRLSVNDLFTFRQLSLDSLGSERNVKTLIQTRIRYATQLIDGGHYNQHFDDFLQKLKLCKFFDKFNFVLLTLLILVYHNNCYIL